MYFSKLPEGFPGTGGDIILTLAGCDADMVTEARIMSGGEILGIKRFRGEKEYDINASCYLRGTIEVEPFLTRTRSGFIEMSERLPDFNIVATMYTAGEDGPGEETQWVDSGPVRYTPGRVGSPPQTILTEVGDAFTVASGETFELPFISRQRSMRGMLVVYAPEFTHEVFFTNAGLADVNLYLFVVNPVSVENAIGMKVDHTMELEVIVREDDGDVLVTKRFAVKEKRDGEVRLCWTNRYGAVDYYTFSPVQRRTVSAEKNRTLSAGGRRTSHVESEETVTVQSPFIPAAHLEEISGIVTSPKVWLADGLDAIEVDIVSDSVVIDRDGPQKLVLTYRIA